MASLASYFQLGQQKHRYQYNWSTPFFVCVNLYHLSSQTDKSIFVQEPRRCSYELGGSQTLCYCSISGMYTKISTTYAALLGQMSYLKQFLHQESTLPSILQEKWKTSSTKTTRSRANGKLNCREESSRKSPPSSPGYQLRSVPYSREGLGIGKV